MGMVPLISLVMSVASVLIVGIVKVLGVDLRLGLTGGRKDEG